MEFSKNYLKLKDKLNFKEIGTFKNDSLKGYFISYGLIDSRKFLLKVITQSDCLKSKSLFNECLVSEIINQSKKANPLIHVTAPLVIKKGNSFGFTWILREFINGETLANPKLNRQKAFFLDRYTILQPIFEKDRDELISKISNNLKSFQKLNVPRQLALKLKEPRFKKDISEYNIGKLALKLGFSLDKHSKFYHSISDKMFKSSNIVFTIGDLVPSNIIIKEHNKIFFSDFEWIGIDNNFFDVSWFWLFLYKYPDWQKIWLQKMVISQEDQDLFRANIIRQLIAWYYEVFFPYYTDQRIKANQERHSKLMWKKYLHNADKSFNDLVNTK